MKQAASVGLIAPCTRHAERVNVGGRSGRERERERPGVWKKPLGLNPSERRGVWKKTKKHRERESERKPVPITLPKESERKTVWGVFEGQGVSRPPPLRPVEEVRE